MIKNIIEEIKKDREIQSEIFGNYITLNNVNIQEDFMIDTLDILNKLNECNSKTVDYFKELKENDLIHEILSTNTSDYSNYLSNDIYYTIYDNFSNGTILIKLKVRLFGDCKIIYSNECILEFSSELDFYEILLNYKLIYVNVNDSIYCVKFNCMNEIVDIFDSKNNYITSFYNLISKNDFINKLSEYLKMPTRD